MPTPETQALLNEIKTPTHSSTATVTVLVQNVLPELSSVRAQLATYQGLTQAVKVAESDEAMRGRLELYFQTFGAMQRHLADIERSTLDLLADFRQLDRYDADIRTAAADQGYVG